MLETYHKNVSEIRFNELLRRTKQLIPKFSATTLLRHLEPLRKNGLIKKTKKGSQNVVYSLTEKWSFQLFSEDELITFSKQAEKITKNIGAYNLSKLSRMYLEISKMLAYDNLTLRINSLLGEEPEESISFRMELRRYFYEEFWGWIYDSMANREKDEYKKILKVLKEQKRETQLKMST